MKKQWGIVNRQVVIGDGPYKTYKRLMGTQYGIIYRGEEPVILAIALSQNQVQSILGRLRASLEKSEADRLGYTQHEKTIIPPPNHIVKRHHHRAKRRISLANRHLTWWVKTPGFPRNLNPRPTKFDKEMAELVAALKD